MRPGYALPIVARYCSAAASVSAVIASHASWGSLAVLDMLNPDPAVWLMLWPLMLGIVAIPILNFTVLLRLTICHGPSRYVPMLPDWKFAKGYCSSGTDWAGEAPYL